MQAARGRFAALVVAALLAGCVSPGASGWFDASVTNPVIMPPPGTPYDGTGMKTATGSMTIHARDADNTGEVHVELDVQGLGHVVVHWTDFHDQPGQAWQDGGIASNLVEHGASGQGNKMEPQFDLTSGGWGTANATVDGKPLVDPVTGATSFNAHYMVTKQAMLEPGTMKVYKSDRKTIFDPQTPGDGYVFPGRPEGHFALWGQGAFVNGYAVPAPAAQSLNFSDTATGPGYDKTFPVPVAGLMSTIAVSAQLTGGAGQLVFTLKDPSGQSVSSADVTPLQPTTELQTPPGPLTAGNYTLEVTGTGVQAAYAATATVTPAAPILLHVVFQDVHVGS